ncbi:MAG: helix-turn-helix transcriptional regulator [Acidobacteriota bacterium]|nr:MAG: helix-turn-helix transcriptional regulator [Acidobacteriota bacterium]
MSIYQFPPFRLETRKRLLLRGDEVIPLTPKAFEVLQLLIEHRGLVISREAIIESVWPDTAVEEGNLTVNISALRKALGDNHHDHKYIVTHSGRGYSFVAEVEVVEGNIGAGMLPSFDDNGLSDRIPAPVSQVTIDPAGGALPIHSGIYIERPADQDFLSAIARGDSLVLVKGARQVGKTSLLARGLQLARSREAKVVITDLQNLNSAHFETAEKFFLGLAEDIAYQMEIETKPVSMWNEFIGPSINFERYWRREILGRTDSRIVWGLDEVDRLFNRPFGSEVFGLFRSWHNKRALEPEGPWQRLTLVISYATEAHLFITDLNQSPFNVGTRLYLNDFTMSQLGIINHRYGTPIRSHDDLQRLYSLVGGHPYLVNRTFWEMSTHGLSLDEIYRNAAGEESIFGDHLHRLLHSLNRDEELKAAVVDVIEERGCSSAESFYRLRSAGIVHGGAPREAVIRCELYRLYLRERL